MTRTFDQLCSEIIGEDIMSATKPQTASTVNKPAQPAQNPVAPQPTPAAQQQQNQQQTDDEQLMKLLQQKMADEKFKQSLLQLLNSNQ